MSDTQFDNLRQTGRDTMNNASDTANDMSKRVGDAAADAGAAVRDATRKVSSKASDVGQQVYERGQQYSKTVMDQVENQPLTSVLVATAAGFLPGLLLSRR